MKKAEDYLKGCEHDGSYIPVNEVIRIIKQVQIEAIGEAVKRCANEPVYKVIGTHNQATNLVRKEILKVAEQLRKEISWEK